MGFDIEYIVDIHQCPGEYFCPLCRTLVYPDEAVQSQCTHLYCKPCLTYVANGSRMCSYDGYLVTESDSKPLVESDKALAEKIGKIKVHCLFVRSGCTWEGALSECSSHCSGCFFGNSHVVCNRCGAQFLHKQANKHAQSCPGGYVAQQYAAGGVNATGLSANTGIPMQSYGQVPPEQAYFSYWQTYSCPPSSLSLTSGPPPQPHSYQLTQSAQKMHPGHANLSSGALNPAVVSPAQVQQPFQNHPAMQPNQRTAPQQYFQQPPCNVPFQGQSHMQGHIPQQPIQPCGPPPPQQLQNYTERPMMPNQGPNPQTMVQSSCNIGTVPHTAPVQVGSKQISINKNNTETRLEQNTIAQAHNKPIERGSELQSMRKDATEIVKSRADAAHDMLPSVKQDKVDVGSSGAKSSEAGTKADEISGKDNVTLKNSYSMKHKDLENPDTKSSKVVVGRMSSADSDKQSMIDASKYRNEGSSGTATLRDHKRKIIDRERSYPFSVEATRPPSHSIRYNGAVSRPGFGASVSHSRFLPPHGLNRIENFGVGPEVRPHHMNHFGSDRKFSGVSAHGSRSSNSSPVPFYESRFPPSFDHLRRGSIDDHMGAPIFNSHNMRGDFGPGAQGNFLREDFAGPGHNYGFLTGSFHGMRNDYPCQGLPNDLNLKGGPEYFDLSRRRPVSTGWCRLCQVDCETIDELEIHSQTREHQNIAMDMVKTIKQRASMGHISHDSGSVRNFGHE